MKSLLKWSDVSDSEWENILERSLWWSAEKSRAGDAGRGKNIALMFFNDSLRTRISMELAAVQLGAHPTVISPGAGTWNFSFADVEDSATHVMDGPEAEHIKDAVGVVSGMYDAIGVRLFASGTDYEADRTDRLIRQIQKASSVPVINLESAFYHPCQAMADATVLSEHFKRQTRGRKFVLAWTRHPKALPMAVPNSALLMAARMGMEITVARPDSHALDPSVMDEARNIASGFGQRVHESEDLDDAVNGAHVVYAKSWGGKMAYDDPEEEAEIRQSLKNWTVNERLMSRTEDGIFMHCLPVRRNVVVTDAVLDGPAAVHQRQAQCRLGAQKAILENIWTGIQAPASLNSRAHNHA